MLEQRNLVVPATATATATATHGGGGELNRGAVDAHLVEHLLGVSIDHDVGSVDLGLVRDVVHAAFTLLLLKLQRDTADLF